MKTTAKKTKLIIIAPIKHFLSPNIMSSSSYSFNILFVCIFLGKCLQHFCCYTKTKKNQKKKFINMKYQNHLSRLIIGLGKLSIYHKNMRKTSNVNQQRQSIAMRTFVIFVIYNRNSKEMRDIVLCQTKLTNWRIDRVVDMSAMALQFLVWCRLLIDFNVETP